MRAKTVLGFDFVKTGFSVGLVKKKSQQKTKVQKWTILFLLPSTLNNAKR
jgi:hypothetical protein